MTDASRRFLIYRGGTHNTSKSVQFKGLVRGSEEHQVKVKATEDYGTYTHTHQYKYSSLDWSIMRYDVILTPYGDKRMASMFF